ncbi:hypothetical protein RAN3_1888 [plant metagenome]|uniref:Phage protein n=1 Tax=plant metagenome TaxID=1297885 RepID=A0A484VAH9_9ZZZZ
MIDPFELVPLDKTLGFLREDLDTPQEAVEIQAQAALDHCLAYCDRADYDSAEALPPRFKACYLMTLSTLWNHRDAATKLDLKANPVLQDMLYSMRDLRDKTAEEA